MFLLGCVVWVNGTVGLVGLGQEIWTHVHL